MEYTRGESNVKKTSSFELKTHACAKKGQRRRGHNRSERRIYRHMHQGLKFYCNSAVKTGIGCIKLPLPPVAFYAYTYLSSSILSIACAASAPQASYPNDGCSGLLPFHEGW